MFKVRRCINSQEVCEFLNHQAKRYNLNVVPYWIVKSDNIYEVFYKDMDDDF